LRNNKDMQMRFSGDERLTSPVYLGFSFYFCDLGPI
jgi:hypothetical protein